MIARRVLVGSVAAWLCWAFVWYHLIVDVEWSARARVWVETTVTFGLAPVALAAGGYLLSRRDAQFAATLPALGWAAVPGALLLLR